MVPLEVWFLGGAVLAFGSALLLVSQREHRVDRTFFRIADENGWDCRHMAPEGLASRLAAIAQTGPVEETELYLSGPAASGPFQLLRAGRPGTRRDIGPQGWTLLHLRTSVACPGLWIGPAPRFDTGRGHEARVESAFARRFLLRSEDPAVEARFGEELRALLMRPQVPVRVGWEGQDLVVAFPLGVSSAEGVQTILRYASALEARFTGRVSQLAGPSPRAPDSERLGVPA